MQILKYKVITNKNQYKEYCNALEHLTFSGLKDRNTKDEMALLTVLIEKWDAEHNTFADSAPINCFNLLWKNVI